MNDSNYVQLVTNWLDNQDAVSQAQLEEAHADLKKQQVAAEWLTSWNFDCPQRALFRSLEGAAGKAVGDGSITCMYTAQHWLTVYHKRIVTMGGTK